MMCFNVYNDNCMVYLVMQINYNINVILFQYVRTYICMHIRLIVNTGLVIWVDQYYKIKVCIAYHFSVICIRYCSVSYTYIIITPCVCHSLVSYIVPHFYTGRIVVRYHISAPLHDVYAHITQSLDIFSQFQYFMD